MFAGYFAEQRRERYLRTASVGSSALTYVHEQRPAVVLKYVNQAPAGVVKTLFKNSLFV